MSFEALVKQTFVVGQEGEENVVLTEAGLEKIRCELRKHLASEELFDHAKVLLRSASRLETVHASPTAAARLRSVVEEKRVILAMRSMRDERRARARDEIAATARAFASFVEPKRRDVDSDRPPENGKQAVTIEFFNLSLRA